MIYRLDVCVDDNEKFILQLVCEFPSSAMININNSQIRCRASVYVDTPLPHLR